MGLETGVFLMEDCFSHTNKLISGLVGLTKRASKALTCHHSRAVVELLRKAMVSCVTEHKIARIQGKCFLTPKRKGKTRAGKTKQDQNSFPK